MPKFLLIILVALLSSQAESQTSITHPNHLSVISAIPRGCLDIPPGLLEVPRDQVFLDGVVEQDVPLVAEAGGTGTVSEPESVKLRIQVWRHGCHDPNRSALLVNMSLPEGVSREAQILIDMEPSVSFEDDNGEISLQTTLWQPGIQHLFSQAFGYSGYAGGLEDGLTFILDTESHTQITSDSPKNKFDELIARYNGEGTLKFQFGNVQGTSLNVTGSVPEYNPTYDEPQLPSPTFSGRMTGQWINNNFPATGLLLQVAEVPKQSRNYIFAIWFTYIDGQPVWMAGNKDISVNMNRVTLDLSYFEGGELFTQAGGFDANSISSDVLGKITLKVNNCNELLVDTDLTSSGFGASSMAMERLIRIAGYDCDGTQSIQ